MGDADQAWVAVQTAVLLQGRTTLLVWSSRANVRSWCGTGIDYCAAPDCQYQYGPQCDANIRPSGTSTANIARPKLGSIPYGGTGIYDCAVPGR